MPTIARCLVSLPDWTLHTCNPLTSCILTTSLFRSPVSSKHLRIPSHLGRRSLHHRNWSSRGWSLCYQVRQPSRYLKPHPKSTDVITNSGDPGGDLFTSPGDPAFYVHHGMMDRMWSYWQLLDPTRRFSEEEMNGGDYGHITWTNEPESRKAQLSDQINMGYAADSTTIGAVMDPLAGPFCYFYA